MKEHEIVLDVRLAFKVPASHEVVALTRAVMWVQKHIVSAERDSDSILKRVGFNLEENLKEGV